MADPFIVGHLLATILLTLPIVHEAAPAFLNLPADDRGPLPPRLSQTGAFRDTRTLTPVPSLIAYEVNAPFWSDGATKRRWIAVPKGKIHFTSSGEWTFPAGTVFVKHFEIGTDANRPELTRRLETRLLVRDRVGGVYGVNYRWRADNSDADLVTSPRTEPITIRAASGLHAQNWYFPGPADCRQCHTPAAGGVLGVKTRQLNGLFRGQTGLAENQLRAWSRLDLFDSRLEETEIAGFVRLARLDDRGRTLEDRARSFLDANCAQCHRPGGAAADFDARYETPLPAQRLLGVPVRINLAIDNARFVAPNDPWRSAILTRIDSHEPTRMPPLAHEVIDRQAVELLRAWIQSLPGPPVVAPPVIEPASGEYRGVVRMTLAHGDPAATVRYTLDGTAPGKASAVYTAPIEVTRSTTVRARAYRTGWTRSVTVQETFILEEARE